MKHIKKFNESLDSMTLTMDDVKKLKHNLDMNSGSGDFMSNYGWDEDDTLEIGGEECSGDWMGKKVSMCSLESEDGEFGYAVLIDGKFEYLIGIYEPHGCSINGKRGLVSCHGHEDIIRLWLDDGEFEEEATR